MTTQTEISTLAVKVGEISGQLREVIHTVNNMAQKVDGMTERLLTSPTTADFEKLSKRVDALEAERHRNDGAKGVFAAILRSKAFGVVVTALVSVAGAILAVREGLVR